AAVTMAEFEAAKDKVMMGAERRSMVMTEKEKRLTAYHEVGHALVGLNMPEHDPLHKVTIIPRGRALGVTMSLPENDRLSFSYTQLKSQLASLFGGRAAEEIVFGKEHITTGASNDIEKATTLARRMITEFGMSETLGAVRYNANEEEVFLGHSVARQQNVSEETARRIDDEVRKMIDWAENKAREILSTHLEDLHKVAKALLEYETLSGEEVMKLMRGESISRSDGPPPAAPKPTASKQGSVPAGAEGGILPHGLEPQT
nr:cell division protein FtsH [Alphaproteobacteria bacterium]